MLRKDRRGARDGNGSARRHDIWRGCLSPSERKLWAKIETDPTRGLADAAKWAQIRLARLQRAERKFRRLQLAEEVNDAQGKRLIRRRPDFDNIAIRLLRTWIRAAGMAALYGAVTDPNETARQINEALRQMQNIFAEPGEDVPIGGDLGPVKPNGHDAEHIEERPKPSRC